MKPPSSWPAYAGHTHRLNPWILFLVASAAAIIGDNIGFWIGDKGGYRLARRYGHWFASTNTN